MIDRKEMVGGVCLHTGTIPSKTLREAILYLSGFREKTLLRQRLLGQATRSPSPTSPSASRRSWRKEMEVVRAQLARNHVATVHGTARFVDPHTLEVAVRRGADAPARGARPDRVRHAAGAQPDGAARRQARHRLGPAAPGHGAAPADLIVVGAGVIGLEYASMVTALGIKVTVIEARPTILDFVDAR